MSADRSYEPPSFEELGRLDSVTLGGPGSRPDGFSGSSGNPGRGRGGTGSPPPGR